MWEILYERVPFEGEIKDALEYVVNGDARPLILTMESQLTSIQAPSERVDTFGSEMDEMGMRLTEEIANIIRRCWQSSPSERLQMSKVVKLLTDQQAVLFDLGQEDFLDDDNDNDEEKSDESQ